MSKKIKLVERGRASFTVNQCQQWINSFDYYISQTQDEEYIKVYTDLKKSWEEKLVEAKKIRADKIGR
ncbi:hypothetical protein [Serratia phage SP1]|nr:hypothetical protein [Serratia phage SP1]